MSASAKLVCSTNNKDVFEVGAAIEKTLKDLMKAHLSPELKNCGPIHIYRALNIKMGFCPSSKYLTFDFKLGEENRTLMVHFGCDSDYEKLNNKPKIICSMGSWGKSDEIILALCKTMKEEFGSVHYTLNDCESEELSCYKPLRKCGKQ